MNLESGQADSLSFCSYDEIFVTKGDANKTQDLSPVPEDQLVGTYLWHVPVLGVFHAFVRREGSCRGCGMDRDSECGGLDYGNDLLTA